MKHNNIINDQNIMKILYRLAYKSYSKQEIPVGAIVIYNNKIIGKGYNNRQSKHNVCGHAEINAIIDAEKTLHDWRLNDCIIISTLKPCDLCSKVIFTSRIKNVYYILDQEKVNNDLKINYERIYFPGNKYIEKYTDLFTSFFKKLR